MKEEVKKWLMEHRKLVLAGVIVVLVLLLIFGAQITLYVNFLLGNDVVIKLSADKEALTLNNDESAIADFTISVTTNPFCSATCESVFEDIGKKAVIDRDVFTLRPGLPVGKSFDLSRERKGEGQELYRFTIQCHSIRTFLCHTNEEPTSRAVLVTVWHQLAPEQQKLKEQLKMRLDSVSSEIEGLLGTHQTFLENIGRLDQNVVVTSLKIDVGALQNPLDRVKESLAMSERLWIEGDYSALTTQVATIETDLEEARRRLVVVNMSIALFIQRFNVFIEQAQEIRKQLVALDEIFLTNKTLLFWFNTTVADFHSFVDVLDEKNTLEQKEESLRTVVDKITPLILSYEKSLMYETLEREIGVDRMYDVLCAISGMCVEHPAIEVRSREKEYNLELACNRVNDLRALFVSLNQTFVPVALQQSYPNNKEFAQNITLLLGNGLQDVTREYIYRLPEDAPNSFVLKQLLVPRPIVLVEGYEAYNLTPALVVELIRKQPDMCIGSNVRMNQVRAIQQKPIDMRALSPTFLNISFLSPSPQCCVFGTCEACCATPDCRDKNFPIVFLHGHAFNKDTAADYSLDAFNKMQRRMEDDGILSAGAVSVYTKHDKTEGLWGMINAPIGVKVSYYYDIFKEPENYVVVQQKSEHIDTYAVRLKDVLDTVMHNTGKNKVIIVAHSMGGLVARRYMQIFGSGYVDRLIMIGTPNNGINGDAADYCPLTGEQRECEDMGKSSIFMKKLNTEKLLALPITNIVGTGCFVNKEKGDGVVLEDDARIAGADNVLIRGTCSGFDLLHTQLLDTDKYPEVYEVIWNALKD